MNERIEGLWWKARIGYNNQNCDPEVLEKFAQLIIRECADICQDIDGEDNIDARSGRQDCAVEIKEHFGVEE
jgi:hypothetical protein